jgi:4-amino-4-deoxy-L-arabinose transferase-like glycosyltransferase
LALWFKFQSSFITLVVPTVMLVEALTSRCMKNLVRDLAWFAAGGIGAGIVYVVPFVLNGILGQFLDLMFTDFELYVDVDGAAVRHSGLERFAIDVPHRALFLIAYAMTAIVVARWVVRLFRSDRRSNSLEPRSGLSLFVAYLLLSMVCVQLGNRFYAHYFQLMVPAVAALTGYALYFFARSSEGRPGRRVAAAAVAALLVIERFPLLSSETLWPGVPRSPETLPALAFVLGALAVMAYWLQRPLRRAGFAAACLILIHTGVLVVQQQLTPRPATMSHSPYRFAELSEYFAREARPGDRLFVWGWAPEIYSLTRLEAGSHITFCQFVVNDIAGVSGPPAFNPVWEKMLMNELGASRPRFIVDASSSSWFETKAGIYDLRNYPDFELNSLLDMHYRQVARLDDCPVWERR